MNVAYMRISTDRQTLDNQKSVINDYANTHNIKIDRYIKETISSTKKDRAIYTIIQDLQPNDNIIVFELSRLARNMIELSKLINAIRDKRAILHVINNNLIIKDTGKKTDVATESLLFALSLSADIERQLISDRVKNALHQRQILGVKLGRPKGSSKLCNKHNEIKNYLSKGLTKSSIAKLLDVNRHTVESYVKAHFSKQ